MGGSHSHFHEEAHVPRPTPTSALLVAAVAWLAAPTANAAPAAPQYVVARERAPIHLIAKEKGSAQLYVNAGTGAQDVAVSVLTLGPGAEVPEHAHEDASETLYIERGAIEMMIAGKKYTAKAGDTVYLPAGVKHSARVLGRIEALKAVQVYVGPGPEQRFTKGPRLKP